VLKSLKWSKDNQKLILILILYLIFATTYSIVVPIGRGADEWAHYWYAEFIAQHGRLPANPAERKAAGYKADWPPLYHLLAAGVTAWVETEGPPTFKYRADNIRRQLVPAFGPEAILHTQDERFPWQQEILIWHLGRFLSIIFTAGTLLVTYFMALEIFASSKGTRGQGGKGAGEHCSISSKPLALITVAILAFIPRFLFTGMLFNYDSLTLLLASLFLWLVIRIVKGYHLRWSFWGLGLLAGLALITKYLAAPLLVVIGVVAWYKVASSKGAEEQRSRGAGERPETRNLKLETRFFAPFAKIRFWGYIGQAALAFLLVTGWWFAYLIITFNEIETYGPVLGTLAPLIRGDGSDRTVEEIFSYLSGGQTPAPAYIERQIYTPWQIIAELPTTLWGNPITRPYPLSWFVWAMIGVAIVAAIGVVLRWRSDRASRLWINLLLLQCVLPLPFMVIRLFGARDALEAVQGRHILFLAGPAVAVLLVWGILSITNYQLPITNYQFLRNRRHATRFTLYFLVGLLLTGAIHQLIFMWRTYPPLLPVTTIPSLQTQIDSSLDDITLEGGARLIGYRLSGSPDEDGALQITLIWRGGSTPAPEDYRVELALVDEQQQIQSSWLADQTQAHYPTRAWEAGDTIFDEGWLPLVGLPVGQYKIRLRILGRTGTVLDWYTLSLYTLAETPKQRNGEDRWILWRNGQIAHHPPILHERETAQLTISHPTSHIPHPMLTDPDGHSHLPDAANARWANFIVAPDWPEGDYYVDSERDGPPIFQVAGRGRNFVIPEITHPLEANFEGQIKLLGYHLPSRRVEAGNGLPITLYWQSLEWMGEEFVIFNRLLDNQQIAWGGYDRLAQENYSTLLWTPGEIIIDGFAVPVASNAPDGVYRLNLGWYRQADGEAKSLHILNPETNELTEATSVTIGPIKVGGPPAGVTVEQATPQTKVNVRLGEKIELLGFDVNRQNTSSLELTFYWQVLAPMDIDYTVFAHVQDMAGELVAQKDSPPLNGVYPTSLWDAGEIVKDDWTIPLEGVESGQYELVIGMYDLATSVRLPVAGSADGTIVLQRFRIGE